MNLPDKAFFRVDELAVYWDVSERSVRRWIKSGKLTAILLNNTVRVPKKAISSFERLARQHGNIF